MPKGEITGYVDVAQLVLYAFWIFFAGLIFYLRREDRREGYPLESEASRGRAMPPDPFLIPSPKRFLLSNGHEKFAPSSASAPPGTSAATSTRSGRAPPGARDGRTARCHRPRRLRRSRGQPRRDLGPREAHRALRVADHFVVHELGPNPIGMSVFGADRQVAGTVSDLWVDRGESMVRYYEVELGAGGRRILMPATFCRTGRFSQRVTCEALLAHQFADIPTTKDPDSVTLNEEERIMAFFGGGTLYATPTRQEAIV